MSSNVLVVEDDSALREALSSSLQVGGYNTTAVDCAESAMNLLAQGELPDMVITDVQMEKMNGIELLKNLRQQYATLPVILMTAYSDIDDAVEVMKLGACDYLQKPFEAKKLNDLVKKYINKNHHAEIIIEDEKSQEIFCHAQRIAQTDSNVLLTGPSGSGKEIMSRFIHTQSKRADEAFVAINCAAIPENMLEASLFGYEKGAFTGAHQSNSGKFEQAQNGTLLLDEISEMDLGLQAKLLRVIQEKEVERLGGKKVIKLDVRIIATTNRDLKLEVKQNRFREDLYYRLNVFPIRCLGLAERSKDIIPLAESILKKNALKINRPELTFSPGAKQKLLNYSWPGNVRELDNLVQRVALLSLQNEITSQEIEFENDDLSTQHNAENHLVQSEDDGKLGSDLQNHEFQLIIEALKKYHGKKKDVAQKLGISPRTLRYKLAKMRALGYQLADK